MPDDQADQAVSDGGQMPDDRVLYETDGPVGVITINRPQKLNAISPRLMHAWWDGLRTAEADESTSVVVLRSEGPEVGPGVAPFPVRRVVRQLERRLDQSAVASSAAR